MCRVSDENNMPTLALEKGLWIGDNPVELQDLTYTEQLLIARGCHNRCIVRVSSGMFKILGGVGHCFAWHV